MRVALVMALALLLAAPQAAMADTKALKAAKAKARALIKSGDLNYRLAKFKEALANYEAAYKAHVHPAILFNIAQCHRQLKNHEKALFFYRLCLSDWRRKNPNPPFLREVENQITKLNDVMVTEQKQKAVADQKRKKEEAERARLEAARKKKEEAERKRRLALVPTKPDLPPPPKKRSTPIYKKWWFWTAVGVVVVGATTAGIVAAQPGDPDLVGGTLRPNNIQLD